MIDLECATRLLDFGRRIESDHRAREQLEGAVALHHMLETRGVAYLADEVGMGKTYVALGVLALYRHFNPSFRALVIAPRANIQSKWQKELRNFVAHNVRFSDLRVRDLDGSPTRPMVDCGSLTSLVHEVGVNPDRDFFLRMPSFSLGLSNDPKDWRLLQERLRRELPWLPSAALSHRDKQTFKDRVACAICCALPSFDLVIVDEAHNLKHGFGPNVSSRNRVMSLCFGHPNPGIDTSLFKTYGPRVKRVLFLSATPIEDDYRQLWNQLHVFGRGGRFEGLIEKRSDNDKKQLARSFLIRRVTKISVADQPYTKNQYRREWRRGGVEAHDHAHEITDERERLIVALMQKKVTELIGLERFGASFQVGMLASFESFLETSQGRAKRAKLADTAEGNFDDAEQTEDVIERRGIDVSAINTIARDHRAHFGEELPHPKMNALVRELDGAWRSNQKALVFVRRVRSVAELKRRLDDRYDEWLMASLRRRLPTTTIPTLDAVYQAYGELKRKNRDAGKDSIGGSREDGDIDTFFAHFFRGDGPPDVVSGARVQARFTSQSSVYASFFEDNHVAWLLNARPGKVIDALARVLARTPEVIQSDIAERGRHYLSAAERVTRGPAFVAAQAAALELLHEHGDERARIVWHELYQVQRQAKPREAPEPELMRWLETPTFFSELRVRQRLREALWPAPSCSDPRRAFREQEQRAQLLSAASRLGHAFIDLYVLSIHERGTLESGQQRSRKPEADDSDAARIHRYLDLLERSQRDPSREFGAFDELAAIAGHFELLLDVNFSEARSATLAQTANLFSERLRRQQPIGGMTGGSVNQTLIRQFRMPGYPFVLVATDVLQEGEDLHTFCSRVYHYGISWTPSSIEQRTGRIDRVSSQSDRRFSGLNREIQPSEKLQVYFPHLTETVESLQIRRILDRMDRFLRLMHEGLAVPAAEDERKVKVDREILQSVSYPEPIRETLETAFDIPSETLQGGVSKLACEASQLSGLRDRLRALRREQLGGFPIEWEPDATEGPELGTARLGERVQPFALLLRSVDAHLSVRCISPVGEVGVRDGEISEVMHYAASLDAPVAAAIARRDGSYDLTVEDEALLGEPAMDEARVGLLLRRIVTAADRLERALLERQDAPMTQFAKDLSREGATNV